MTRTQRQYRRYLQSPLWRIRKMLASAILSLAIGKLCIMCNAPRRDWHHRHYGNVGNELPIRDIVPVCRECHKKFHNK
jgi:hypothetical protein